MLFVLNYCDDGVAVGDNKAIDFVKEKFQENNNQVIDVSTENTVYALRVLVKRGEIPCENVAIKVFGGDYLRIDRDGRFLIYPHDLQFLDNVLGELLSIETPKTSPLDAAKTPGKPHIPRSQKQRQQD